MSRIAHQYIDRDTERVVTERFLGDGIVHALYASARERAPWLFHTMISPRVSRLLGYWHYDVGYYLGPDRMRRFMKALDIDLTECVRPAVSFKSPRQVFERQIRYWDVRPLSHAPSDIASPADARVLAGSFSHTSHVFLKEKFFHFTELLGEHKPLWLQAFNNADYAIFRLTPEKYHYNHAPVSGTVVDIYDIAGDFHSCNPGPVTTIVTPFSKNKRVVTIIDTDVPRGTGVGLVAMIEVVALMIGTIEQCYSHSEYHNPQAVTPGLFLHKGQPKSLFRPGSSTTILMFQPHRVRICEDLLVNLLRHDVHSRYSAGFGRPLVETDVKVRSTIATAADQAATQTNALFTVTP